MENLIESQVGKYRLIKLLGQGSFAQVYLGEHLDLKTLVAIKMLISPFDANNGDTILKEAQTIARLSHPHIIRVLDFDIYNSFPYLVMDYYPNGNLRQRYPKGSILPPDLVVSYAKQIAQALQYAHDNSIIHRDIKPENLLLSLQNEVVLTDFGIAMTQSVRQTSEEVAGTAVYMAPEQFQGKAHRATDQYALGAIMYEYLAGRPPFKGSFAELAGQHMMIAPPPLRTYRPRVPANVEEVILKALRKDPQERFATVLEFAHALQQAYQSSVMPSLPPDDVIQEKYVYTPYPIQSNVVIHEEFSLTPSLIPTDIIHKKPSTDPSLITEDVAREKLSVTPSLPPGV